MKKNGYVTVILVVIVFFMFSHVSEAQDPQRFFLDFSDAYLVYSTGSNSLQIATAGCVLSYGVDWQKVKVKPYLYDLKQNVWQGFYWRVNTSRKEVYRYKGNNFGKIGDSSSEKIKGITVDVVGNSKAPTRFLLKFSSAYLVYSPANSILQIVTEGNVLSYGGDWGKCKLKSYLYELQQNVWKGFYWKINTSRKEVYQVSGAPFCQMGGTQKTLKIGVRVVN